MTSSRTIKDSQADEVRIYFTDYFAVDPLRLEEYGAFNISLINDLPLFIDPFLLYASKKKSYHDLHENIIDYLKFLRDRSLEGTIPTGLLHSWYRFPEVKQLWLGFSTSGNGGSGLGSDFANALSSNLARIFSDFGNEKITHATHMEKLCLVADGVGRDCISDFTANLIKSFLCEYTQAFARKNIDPSRRRVVSVEKAYFDSHLERWMPREYELPYFENDYVLLTPRDMLTRDESWINRSELVHGLERIVVATSDTQLREQLDNYIRKRLKEDMSEKERAKVYSRAIREHPEVIDHYIRQKEDTKDKAIARSNSKVEESEALYIRAIKTLAGRLKDETQFYQTGVDTLDETRARISYFKDVIENKGGWRLFYRNGRPWQNERDLQLMYKFVWRATSSSFDTEVNNGSGPVDSKASRGSKDSTLAEFKLAKSPSLERNLLNQVASYRRANSTEKALKVIFYFTAEQLARVEKILRKNRLDSDPDIILIDVRDDNKPSASKA